MAPVFCNLRGGLIHKSNFYTHSFAPAVKRAGLSGLRFHDLRHTAATMLGHKDASVTLNVYAHVLPQMDEERAAVMQRILAAS
jgi:integrase